MKRTHRHPLLMIAAGFLSAVGLSFGQTTVFHYRVNDTDAGGLPTVPSIGGLPGVAQAPFTNLFSPDVPIVGVPPGAGNRSLVGANDPGSNGVNSGAQQELLNATIIANGGFTYECWFKWFGVGNVNSIIDYAGTEKLRIPATAYPLDMRFDTGSGNLILNAAPTANEWHYIAMVFTHDGGAEVGGQINGTATWYYDSNEATGSAAVIKDDFGDSLNRFIGIGRHPNGFAGDTFDGLIYEPRVTLGALASIDLLYTPAPERDPQIVVAGALSGNSDGNAIQLTVPIRNLANTTQDLVLTAPGISGGDAADFVVASFDTPIVANGGTGSIVIDFTPSSGDGIYTTTLTINSSDPVEPSLEVTLTVDVRDPAIVIDSGLDFGIYGGVPAPFEDFILVENRGGLTDLTLTNPQIAGAGAAAYTVTVFPSPVAPGVIDQILIEFAPSEGGDFPAQLTLETNDPRNPVVTVNLSAEIHDPEMLIDSLLSFGSFANSPGPQSGTIFVDNFGEDTDLVVSNPQISGPAAANFSVSALPGPIAPFGNDVIEVTFDPGAAGGSFVAFLTLDTNDPFAPTATVAVSAFVEGPIDLEGPSKLSHWTFDDPDDLGNDSGGLNYDGTLGGNVQPSGPAAVGSGAVVFDGDGDYIEIPQGAFPYAAMDDDGEGFTVASWVCSSSAGTPNRQRYFTKFFDTGAGGFGVGQNNDTQFIATTFAVADYLGGVVPAQDEWHHIAFVYRGSPPSAVDYYVDGVFSATTVGGPGMNDGPGSFAIGGFRAVAPGEFFDGLLDDLRVYAVELPAADIATLAAMGTPGPKSGTPSVAITSVALVNPTRLRIEFAGAANRLHEVKSSGDLVATPFTGAVTPAVDGLTTDGSGAGFVEIDLTIPGTAFFQIQLP